MSELIGRNEHRHLNVKVQDVWKLKEGMHGPGYATLVLNMNPYNAPGLGGGRLYLNDISLKNLEELCEEITRFLEQQKPRMEDLRRSTEDEWPEFQA